jgi:hypothetical protein
MQDQDAPAAAPTYAMDEIALRAAEARRRSAWFSAQGNRTAARPVWDYNHVMAYGQSLSSGWEGWPAMSVAQRHDSLMVGSSVHGTNESGPRFDVAGTSAFQPLVATVMANGPKGEVLAPEAVAALPVGNVALGETVLEGALDFWRGRQLAGPEGAYPGRFVATSTGVGGRTIEQLSFGQGPFERPRQAAQVAKRLAEETGGNYGIAALLWLQGESNSVGSGTQDRRGYFDLTQALQADFNREIAQGVAGQEAMPAVFTHQVGGIYVRDATNMSIPMAQLDCAYALPDWFMVGPAYPVTEKAGHLDPNGYRWLGQQFGKVMHRVLDLGEGWKPVHPMRATLRGAQVLVDFHVPHPPLVFSPCYVRTKATSFADGGFRVTDEAGEVGVVAAAVVDEVSVLLVLERAPGADAVLWYADQTRHGGYGNLRDSDPTRATQAYEFREGSGQYPGANLTELIGQPYPLWNWCIAFRTALEPDPVPLVARPAPAPPADQPVADDAVAQPDGVPTTDVASPANAPEAEQPVAAEEPAAVAPLPRVEVPLRETEVEGAAETPAWQVLRGAAVPPASPPAVPPAPPARGFLAWLRRLFGGG